MNRKFSVLLRDRIKFYSHNCYWDQVDYYPARYCEYNLKWKIITFLRNLKWVTVSFFNRFDTDEKIDRLFRNYDITGFARVYDLLNDECSRETYLNVIILRMIGAQKIKMPLSDKQFYVDYEKYKCLKVPDSKVISFHNFILQLYSLKEYHIDYNVYCSYNTLFKTFVFPQYEYKQVVGIKEGDYVIDAGACWGDTTLRFAHFAGETGKVYAFEFSKENLNIFYKYMELNPNYQKRIELFQNAIWSDSTMELFVNACGAATSVTSNVTSHYDYKIKSVSIDDLLLKGSITKVDFIKMDIEGAELEALKGAKNAIQKYKPRLAICIYHDISHFVSIPDYLHSIMPEYKFYLNHHSIGEWETVLYCV